MQADALAQYEGLFATGTVIHAACNAHARRRFVEAQASAPAEAEEALKYIRKLYNVERTRQTTTGSPTGSHAHGDRAPVVAQRLG